MRSAQFTTPAADEVALNYIIEATAGSSLHNTPGIAFYPVELYRMRQKQHGVTTYPEPQPANF